MNETWNLIRTGTVEAVDFDKARVKVTFDELEITSDWLPVVQVGAKEGNRADFSVPAIGEKVICLFYSDSTEEGVCIGSYYPLNNAPAGTEGLYYSKFPDGSEIKWQDGTLEIKAPEGMTIDADLQVDGNVQINGTLQTTGNITCSGIVYASTFVVV